MKRMKERKRIIIAIGLFLSLGTTAGFAQVTIGADQAPRTGAGLDLNSNKGLLLPRVTLSSTATDFQLDGGDPTLAKGMVVYNTGANLGGPGVFVWDGSKWSIVQAELPAVTIETVGSGTSFCGGVTFKLTKPTSWTTAQWTSLAASNVTATLAGDAYNGTLTYNAVEDSYYYGITAAAVGQSAVITVNGSISGTPIAESTKTVTVNLNTDSSFKVGGENCFDIKRSSDTDPDWNNRTQADFTKTYDYSLSGTVGSGFTITSVTWSYSNPEDAVETFTPLATSTTPASNKVTVKYNPANLIGNTNIDATGIQVIITATIVATSTGACPTAVYTVSRTVTIKNADCCSSVTDAEGNDYTASEFGIAGCWMTQNLRSTYTMQGATKRSVPIGANADDSYTAAVYYYPNGNQTVYNNNPTYGLYYTWAAANIGASATENKDAFSGTISTRQGICPSDWHLPSDYEWAMLEKEIASNPSAYSLQQTPYSGAADYDYAGSTGTRPKPGSVDETYWGRQMKSQTPVNGATNGSSKPASEGGFDVLLVGVWAQNKTMQWGQRADFWTASATKPDGYSQIRQILAGQTTVSRIYMHKGTLMSVRCVKNK
ncbi:MAG: fibrobacter succinogenes major paralogous domain-containing protein [Candidatus Symbiothrix sp.]|nr:fibrobacter succinogenes major paralogous domain-containing protein [Candidatus Symbiothrix sp.]